MKTTSKKNFTLLEIVICVAILGTAAVTLGWQMKGLLSVHHFNQNVEHFLVDLKKCQLIALSDRVDVEIHIEKRRDGYLYWMHCDDPIPCFSRKIMQLKGVEKIQIEKKPVSHHTLTIYSSGRISPTKAVQFFQKDEKGVIFLLTKTPLIEIKRNYSL